MNSDQYYTPDQAAHIIHVGRNKIYQLLHEGKLPSYKIGSHYKISSEQLQSFLKNSESKNFTEVS